MFRDDSFCDHAVRLLILTIGAAEAAHMAGLVMGRTIGECTILFGGLLAVLFLAYFFICFYGARAGRKKSSEPKPERKVFSKEEKWLAAGVALVWLAMLCLQLSGKTLYRDGDMTAETVESFLAENGIYRVNPLTGAPYTAGIPSRVAILGLPSLYSFLAKGLGLSASTVVYQLVPVAILMLSFCAFGALGRTLFKDERRKQLLFLLAVGAVCLGGCYAPFMDGFGLICSGYRATTIRNLVLVPYTLALCGRRKSLMAIFTILAEACIAWTLYGAGVCLLVTVLWAVAVFLSKRFFEKGGLA